MLQENCYIVSDDTRQAVIIDCGAYFDDERQAIADYISHNQLQPRRLLCTHGHFDHCFGNDLVYQLYGLKPEVAAADEWLMDLPAQMRSMMGTDYQRPCPPIGRLLSADELIDFGSHQLRVLPTPGHTPGGVSFYCEAEHVVFTGDTLFRQSVGRTDFERGSYEQLLQSLRQVLAPLPPETVVYSGHGPATTIADELRSNPYFNLEGL